MLYQLSKQANWKLVTMLVPNKPVKYIPTVIEQKPYGASLTKKLKQSDGLPTWCMTECVVVLAVFAICSCLQLNIALYNVKAYLRRSRTGVMKRLVLLSILGPTRFIVFGRVVWPTSEDAVRGLLKLKECVQGLKSRNLTFNVNL